ncbi:unnamed protein product [Brassicogethes aeneus]|uniref:PH domain-containing protein n=1 Tax=Brassicogethes aeneus TaxID=1431903 RepID=A0A9P0AXL9_BRAAE|nr:unnamed protein product [Brassicogethes aeneus]
MGSEETRPFIRSLKRKKCSCSIHNSRNISDMIKTPSLEDIIQNASTLSRKLGKNLANFISNMHNASKENHSINPGTNNISNEENNNNCTLSPENFRNTLRKWKTLEKEYQSYLEIQDSMEKTLNVREYEEPTLKVDRDVTLAQTTWKLIYDDISSDQNKDKFMEILSDWIKRDTIIGVKPPPTTFSSTPIKNNIPECSLDLSKIYSNASSEQDCRILDETPKTSSSSSNSINTNNIEVSSSDNLDTGYPSSSDSGTNCDYEDNSLKSNDMMLNFADKSDSLLTTLYDSKNPNNLTYANLHVHSENIDDSSIIQDLILTKFEDKIEYQKIKKTNRRKSQKSFNSDVYESIASIGSSIQEYDEKEFLAIALCDQIETEQHTQAAPSVNTNEISDLISNEYYYYDENIPVQHRRLSEDVSYEETNISYIEEIKQQLDVIQQIKKALLVCNTNKELIGSREHIEAEKLLLTATSKYNVLLSSVKTSRKQERPAPCATMYIKDLTFKIKPDYVLDYTYYYMCILKAGPQVKWTNIEMSKGSAVKFYNDVIFERLTPDSQVTLEVYSLKVKNEVQVSNHVCGSINKSFSKLFSRRRSSGVNINPNTSFEPIGTSTLSNVLSSELYELSTSGMSEIDDKFSASVEICLNLKYDFKGFLTIRKDDVKASWVRRWCSLKDDKLSFWSHPTEEVTMEPRGFLDLRCSTGQAISSNLNICSRPRTLVLELQNSGEPTMKTTYFLAADNGEDFHEWQYRLNSTVRALKCWQQMFNGVSE